MFDKLKDKCWDLRYMGIKYTVTETIRDKVEDMKDHPCKTAAKVGIDAASRMVPGGTILKKAGKLAAKTAVKKTIDKL